MGNSSAAASLLAATVLACATCPGTTWYVSPDGTGDGLSPSSRGEAITIAQKMKNEAYGGATFKCDPVEDCLIAGNRARYGGVTYNATSRNCIVVGNVAKRAYAPCRDAGLTLAGQPGETDVLGKTRVKYAGVDMGALECCLSPAAVLVR